MSTNIGLKIIRPFARLRLFGYHIPANIFEKGSKKVSSNDA